MKRNFLLKWEQHNYRSESERFQSLTSRDQDRVTRSTTIDKVLDLGRAIENPNIRRIRKWKEVRHLWQVLRQSECSNISIENGFWRFLNVRITLDRFIAIMNKECRFDESMKMEAHIKWLYWSLNGR
jgi:hypothetical protein